jgi:Carboxypeptidase regulatory-like domain
MIGQVKDSKTPENFPCSNGGIMSRRISNGLIACVVLFTWALLGWGVSPAWGQASSTGTVTVSVLDPDGRAVPDAQLTLQDLSTNDTRSGVTQDSGSYSFVNLSLGSYKLTVTKTGFQTQVFDTITIHATQVTDVKVALKVGVTTESVEVHESETPLIETTSNAISSTIDLKQLEDLPLNGRDVSQLAFLTPGFTGVPGGNGNGTWNGLPVIAQGNNIDGVISSTSRMKFSGNQTPQVSARLEDMQEMTVQTDQLDLSTGFGATDMQVNFITRRGSNSFHGRVFDNYQNDGLNANSWFNDAIGAGKNKLILNDFGGSVGGPILKNKLFFFGSFAALRQPGGYTATNQVLTSTAQGGSFFAPGMSAPVQLIGTPTSVAALNGVNNTINSRVGGEISNVNAITSLGKTSIATGDPDNIQNLSWEVLSPIKQYYPTLRLDYNMSQNVRLNFAWNETKFDQPGAVAPFFPGASYSNTEGANKSKVYTTALGFDWTIKPTLVNQFRGGYLYNWYGYVLGTKPPVVGDVDVQWNLPGGFMSGDGDQAANAGLVTTYYPLFNWSDTATWQHGSHTFSFGASWFREQDHYWNPPAGVNFLNLGLVPGDPAFQPISNALFAANATPAQQAEGEQLYAVLSGDIGSSNGAADRIAFALDPKTKQYENTTAPFVLDELQKAWGVFFQDSWRIKTNLTLNYGLRWDFTGDDHDLKSAYESAGLDGVWGPSGAGNQFKPGTLTGNLNPVLAASGHQYKPWNKSPQPQIGIAWSPAYTDGFLGKLTANGQTVIRAGFSFRNYTEPYQFFWDSATDYGAFFYQNNQLIDNVNPGGTPGEFAPGSLSLTGTPGSQMTFPPYSNVTANYTPTFPESGLTFIQPFQQIYNPGIALGAINPTIKQPYTQSWNLSIQRPLGRNNAIEIRYIGSRSVHQWLNLFTNEVNVFENGFLTQFQQAQKNLSINTANGYTGISGAPPQTFANLGYSGEAATPIFDQAFGGLSATDPGGYGSPVFVTWMQNGSAGAAATALAGGPGGNPTYYCNLVNQSQFAAGANPCNNIGYTGEGGPYPINFFQMNPFTSGQDVGLTTNAGYSNYNGLQLEFRQKQWHGMQFDVNYTWSHTLGINTNNSWTGVFNQYTLRNLRQSYGPLPFDIRHTIHMNGTYDLPFGKGKQYLNRNNILDKVVGGWSVGTVLILQSGEPFQLTGSTYLNGIYSSTFNDFGDNGVSLNGVKVSQLQSSIGSYHVPVADCTPPNSAPTPCPFVDLINPKYLSNNGAGGIANSTYLTTNITPGTIGATPWLHGPRYFNQDFAITKAIPIRENIRFSFQGEFLNAYNHPNFGLTPGANVQGNNFGTAGTANGPRAIELRANIEF